LIFNPQNFSDPIRKAIVEALIAELTAEAEPEPPAVSEVPQVPQVVVVKAAPAPEADAPRAMLKPRGISNRAFQRHLRHQHRLLMNPRHR
jgi:hypothetical protein